MARQLSPIRLRAAFAAGRLEADETIDQAIEHLDAETDPAREAALRTLVTATATHPDRIIDVMDAVDRSLRPGRTLTPEELAALRDLSRRRPTALSPLVDSLGRALSSSLQSVADTALLSRLLGDIGVAAPGVVKPMLGPLVDCTKAKPRAAAVEASWAVVRTSTIKPEVLRPVIAGSVWDLDSHDSTSVDSAVETLGRVGWFLPGHLPSTESIPSLIDHPQSDVREAALLALKWVAGNHGEEWLGIPRPERVEPYRERIAERITDPDADVRLAAIEAFGQLAAANPDLVIDSFDTLMQATDDDFWGVRAAALDILKTAVESTAVGSDAFDLDRVQRCILPLLDDSDSDVLSAAVDFLVTLLGDLGPDRSGFVRYVVDLVVWTDYLSTGLFDGVEPLSTLEEAQIRIPDPARYLRIVRELVDANCDEIRSTTVVLCGFVARQSPGERLGAIAVLQSLLAVDQAPVRRQVLAEFEALVETDSAVAITVGQIASAVFKYDPELRDEAASVLAACHAHQPSFLDEAIGLCCRFLRESREVDEEEQADDGDEGMEVSYADGSHRSGLGAFVESDPGLVADAAPRFIECLDAGDDTDEFVVELLARAVVNGGSIDAETARTIESRIREDNTSPSLVAWFSTLLVAGTESGPIYDRSVDRLHSLAERHDTEPIPSCLALLADDRPGLVAQLLVVHPPLASLPAEEQFSKNTVELLSDAVTAHPRLFLRCRGRLSPYSNWPPSPGDANDRRWLGELAETVPQTVPATDWLRDGFWADDGDVTAQLLETVGRAETVNGNDRLETWTAHPHPDVRAVARELSTDAADSPSPPSVSGDIPPDPAEFDPMTATEEMVDEIATAVAATDTGRCQSALDRLVAIATHNLELRPYVRQHLLASSVTVEEVAAPQSLLGALVTIAPRVPTDTTSAAANVRSDGPIDTGMRASVYQHYATCGTAPVRDVALTALSSLPVETADSSTMDSLTERLQDSDDTVRAQAARTVAHFAQNPAVVSPALVDALIAELRGPRYVRIACCEALGHCAVADPTVVDHVVPALETRLRARERGVRRAASTALARIGQARPDAIIPAAKTLFERYHSDRVVRPELLPVMASVPVSEIPSPERVVEPILSALVETTEPSVSQAAGHLLVAIAEESPSSIRTHLEAVSERLEAQFDEAFMPSFWDVETTPLSTYWLLRVVGTCAADNPVVAKRFEWLVSEIDDALHDEDGTGSYNSEAINRGHITARGLDRASARVAALGGLDIYQQMLEQGFRNPSKPDPDPRDVAQHLVVADSDTRTAVVGVIGDHAPNSHVDALLEQLFEMRITLNRYETVFESIASLLPRTDEKRLHRRGVAVLLESSRGHNWQICKAAVETLAKLGQTAVVRADEVIAHLIGRFDTGWRADAIVADAVADLLQHAQLSLETVFTIAVRCYEQPHQSPNSRQAAIRLVGILGQRHQSVRGRAIEMLIDALSDDDRWVQETAAEAIAVIGDIVPEALQPHHEELEELAEKARGDVADTLESATPCLRQRE